MCEDIRCKTIFSYRLWKLGDVAFMAEIAHVFAELGPDGVFSVNGPLGVIGTVWRH